MPDENEQEWIPSYQPGEYPDTVGYKASDGWGFPIILTPHMYELTRKQIEHETGLLPSDKDMLRLNYICNKPLDETIGEYPDTIETIKKRDKAKRELEKES